MPLFYYIWPMLKKQSINTIFIVIHQNSKVNNIHYNGQAKLDIILMQISLKEKIGGTINLHYAYQKEN